MNYRTTHIYVRSLELVDFVADTLAGLPSGFGFMADQLRRATASVPLNYLEGCGRSGAADRRRFVFIAVGSAMEVAAALEVLHRFGALPADKLAAGQTICDHVAAMLRRFR